MNTEVVIRFLADKSNFSKTIKDVNSESTSFGNNINSNVTKASKSFGSGIGSMVKKLTFLGAGYAGITGIKSVFDNALNRVDSIQSAKKSITQLTGSSQKASKVMDEVVDVIQGTPIALDQMTNSTKGLISAGMDTKKVPTVLQAVGDAAYGVANGAESIDIISSAFKSLQASGTASLGDLNRLLDQNIPVYKILGNEMGKTVPEMKKFISDGLLPSTKAINVLTKGIEQGTNGINKKTTAMSGQMMVAGDTIQGALSNIKTAFTTSLSPVIEKYYPQILDGLNAFYKKIQEVKPYIVSFVDEVVEKFGELGKWIDKIKANWDTIKPVLMGLLPVLASLKLAFSISSIITAVSSAISGLTAVVGVLTAPISLIVLAIGALIGGLVYFYTTNDEVKAKVDEVWNTISSTITNVINTVSAIVQEVWGTLTSWWNENQESIMSKATEIWNSISSTINTVVTEISSFVQNIWGTLSSWFTENQELIKSTAEKVWNAIVSVIKVVMNIIGPYLKVAWNNIKVIISAVWNIIKTVVMTAIKVVLGIIKAVMQMINGDWKGAWNTIKGVLKTVWDGIKSVVSTVIKAIKGIISNILDGIKGVWDKAWNSIKDTVGNIINNIKDKFTNFSLVDIGKNIIQGLIDGISGMIGKVGDIVGNIAGSISDGFKSFFNIHSPSRKMKNEVGKYIILGVGKGITVYADSAVKATKKASQRITSEFNKQKTNWQYGKISSKEYISSLKALMKNNSSVLSSGQKNSIQSQIYKVEQKQLKSQTDAIKKRLKEQEKARKDALKKQKTLNKNVYKANTDFHKKINEINKKLNTDIKAKQDEYKKLVDDRKNTLYSATDIFSFAKTEKVDKSTVTEQLRSQIKQFSTWRNTMRNLEKKLPKTYYEELLDKGVGSLSEVQAINSMTKKELDEYVKMWDIKHSQAKNESIYENKAEKKAMEQAIKTLTNNAKTEVAKARNAWVKELNKLKANAKELQGFFGNGKSIGTNVGKGLEQGLKGYQGKLKSTVNNMGKTIIKTMKKSLGIHSPSRVFRKEIGNNIMFGLMNGLADKKNNLIGQMLEYSNMMQDSMSLEFAGFETSDLISSEKEEVKKKVDKNEGLSLNIYLDGELDGDTIFKSVKVRQEKEDKYNKN